MQVGQGAGESPTRDGAAKWWRWDAYVGRWMPSEPPAVNTGRTPWRVSSGPPSEPPEGPQYEETPHRFLNPYAG